MQLSNLPPESKFEGSSNFFLSTFIWNFQTGRNKVKIKLKPCSNYTDFSEQEISTSRFLKSSISSRRKIEVEPTIELEPKLLKAAYLLATVEVIIFNLRFFQGYPLWNAFAEDRSQGFLGVKF